MRLRIQRISGGLKAWAERIDSVMLAAILAIAIAAWFFVRISDSIFAGRTPGLDERILLAMRNPSNLSDAIGPEWAEQAVRDITALGSSAVITLLTIFVTGYFWIARKRHTVVLILVAVVGGALLNSLLKGIFERPRPSLVPKLDHVTSHSFPSGHAQASAVIYLTLGAILASLVHEPQRKIYLLGSAVAAALLVGMSRVYLGVHYPSDVLGGWIVGFSWALLCCWAAHKLQGRHVIEDFGTAEANVPPLKPAASVPSNRGESAT